MTKWLGWRMARHFPTPQLCPAVHLHVPLGFPELGSVKHKCRGREQGEDILNLSHSTEVWQYKLFFCSLACSLFCVFRRKGVSNSKATGLQRAGFKSTRVVPCASGDLNSFQNRHCHYHYCCYLTFLYRATGLFHTENEDMVLFYRRVQSELEKAFMQSVLWACSLLLLAWVVAREDLSESPVWSFT